MSQCKWKSALPKNREEPGSLEQLLDKSFSPCIQITFLQNQVDQMLTQSQSMKESLCPAQMRYLIFAPENE